MNYTKIGLGFTGGTGPVSVTIRTSTVRIRELLFGKKKMKDVWRDTPTHVYIWFEDDTGHRVYFEALEGSGWGGPLEYTNLLEYIAKDPKRWNKDIDLSRFFNHAGAIQDRYDFCIEMLKIWTYNIPQLALQARLAVAGRKLLGRSLVKASPNQVICSEAGAVVCSNPPLLDFRRWCGCEYDYIVPDQLYRVAMECVKESKVI